jgi:hypothetical protein
MRSQIIDIFILTLVLKSMMPPHPEPFPFLLGLDDQIQARLQISQRVKSTSQNVVPAKAGIHKLLI